MVCTFVLIRITIAQGGMASKSRTQLCRGGGLWCLNAPVRRAAGIVHGARGKWMRTVHFSAQNHPIRVGCWAEEVDRTLTSY